jgi:hypothetical protein
MIKAGIKAGIQARKKSVLKPLGSVIGNALALGGNAAARTEFAVSANCTCFTHGTKNTWTRVW